MRPIDLASAERYEWGEGCLGWNLLERDDLYVVQERIPSGRGETPHLHRRVRQLYYILRGQALVTVGGEQLLLGPGEAESIEAGIVHDIACSGAEPLEFLVISTAPPRADRVEFD
jgi:mannose-6-phosphate isomerase-like protein (cupin superfamily)